MNVPDAFTHLTLDGRPLASPPPISPDMIAAAAGGQGQEHLWRSLDEWGAGETIDLEGGEFAPGVDLPPGSIGRRRFIQLMGASLALAHLTACTREPEEHIVPYVDQPENLVPSHPKIYASATVRSGYALGVLVTTHEGRPTKIEPNPGHPATCRPDDRQRPGAGGTDVFAQASVLSLYDPDRSRAVRHLGQVVSWKDFTAAWAKQLHRLDQADGEGLAFVTGNFTSPTMFEWLGKVFERWPKATWAVHDPVARADRFGPQPIYHLDQADVIFALDHNLLEGHCGAVRYAGDFAAGRWVRDGRTAMNRLYTAGPMPNITSARADHHLPMRASQVGPMLTLLAREIGLELHSPTQGLSPEQESWIKAVAQDLTKHHQRGVLTVGTQHPPNVQRLARLINQKLGAVGSAVEYVEPFDAWGDPRATTMDELVTRLTTDGVKTLVLLGVNPVYDAPGGRTHDQWQTILGKAAISIHHGTHVDETSRLCQWHLPATHELEHWSDARSFEGTTCIVQPTIRPLYHGRSVLEVVAGLLGVDPVNGREMVRSHWRQKADGKTADTELWWRRTLRNGVVAEGIADTVKPAARSNDATTMDATPSSMSASQDEVELHIEPDPRIGGGQWANNAWLQELPKPITKLVWGNAVLLSPAMAARMDVQDGDVIALTHRGRRIEGPAWRVPGHVDRCVTVRLGYGRKAAGGVGDAVGFSVTPMRDVHNPWVIQGVRLHKTGEHRELVTTQHHQSMEGRDLARTATLDDYLADPLAAAGPHPMDPEKTLQDTKAWSYEQGHKWGMTIDLNACIGCGACTIACQAENNIPVVGAKEVSHLREMHWIRVDRYYQGDPANPLILTQPVPCMQCEHAPCEIVCPTGATIHSSEGLNQMTYNRCVGTRYCSNNCPYKVRRFNFFDYTSDTKGIEQLQHNPNVTVRSRGVMEKCTYCVQRIEAARIASSVQGIELDGDGVVTACQAACPTQAIVFGDLNQAGAVAQAQREPRNYHLLAHLNTRPRTTYLASLRNPNPAMPPSVACADTKPDRS